MAIDYVNVDCCDPMWDYSWVPAFFFLRTALHLKPGPIPFHVFWMPNSQPFMSMELVRSFLSIIVFKKISKRVVKLY